MLSRRFETTTIFQDAENQSPSEAVSYGRSTPHPDSNQFDVVVKHLHTHWQTEKVAGRRIEKEL